MVYILTPNTTPPEYKNTLMKDGMLCLLSNLKHLNKDRGADLLYHLGELWLEFMREIIPTLQVSVLGSCKAVFSNIDYYSFKVQKCVEVYL